MQTLVGMGIGAFLMLMIIIIWLGVDDGNGDKR